MSNFDEIKTILSQYKYLGDTTLPNGTELIGRAPHIAPEAWLHCLFAPISYNDVETLEEECHQLIPNVYKGFLMNYKNGLSIFGDVFNLYGLRKDFNRTVETSRQPYSLDTPNTIERPKFAKPEYLFIGGYSWDGSKIYIDGLTNRIYYCARRDATPVFEWNNFDEMLISEVKRLQKHFDKEGKRIDKKIPTVPVIIPKLG